MRCNPFKAMLANCWKIMMLAPKDPSPLPPEAVRWANSNKLNPDMQAEHKNESASTPNDQ